MDSNVETCGPLTDIEIVQMVRPHDCIPDDDDDDIGNEPPPRAADVAAGLALAQRFSCGRKQRRRSTLTHVLLAKLASCSQIWQAEAEDDSLFFLKAVGFETNKNAIFSAFCLIGSSFNLKFFAVPMNFVLMGVDCTHTSYNVSLLGTLQLL